MTKPKSIYYKAAKRIVEGKNEFSCIALSCVEEYDQVSDYARRKYIELFHPNAVMRRKDWWNGLDTKNNRLKRSIALLLMHEMEKQY